MYSKFAIIFHRIWFYFILFFSKKLILKILFYLDFSLFCQIALPPPQRVAWTLCLLDFFSTLPRFFFFFCGEMWLWWSVASMCCSQCCGQYRGLVCSQERKEDFNWHICLHISHLNDFCRLHLIGQFWIVLLNVQYLTKWKYHDRWFCVLFKGIKLALVLWMALSPLCLWQKLFCFKNILTCWQ